MRTLPIGSLVAANGSKIDTWGVRTLTLNFGNKREYKQDFYLANVTRPILGANFFTANNVAIDLRGRRLIDLNSCSTFFAEQERNSGTLSGLALNTASQFDRLLLQFPDILVPQFQSTLNKHGVEHHIVTDGRPTFSRPRRLPADKFSAAKAEFQKLVLFVAQTRRGLHLCTLYSNHLKGGDPAAITDGSMKSQLTTDILFHIYKTLIHVFLGFLYFPRSI